MTSTPMHVNAQEPGTPPPFEFVERILPTPNPVLVVNLGSPFRVRAAHSAHGDDLRRKGWLVGPQTGYVENEPPSVVVPGPRSTGTRPPSRPR